MKAYEWEPSRRSEIALRVFNTKTLLILVMSKTEPLVGAIVDRGGEQSQFTSTLEQN